MRVILYWILTAVKLLKRGMPLTKSCVVFHADRKGGRTVSTEIPAASGVDRWDFGGQWVGR